MITWENKRVLIVGTGLSGMSACKLLMKEKATVILLENNEKQTREEIKKKLPEGMEPEILLGKLPEKRMNSIDLVILSPGVPCDLEEIALLRSQNIPIWGEMELAYQCGKGRVIGITGTNGKTTTTALVGEIMKEYFKDVFVVGNIGLPYTEIALETKEDSIIVAEVSSFQLETIQKFHPIVSAILNITPDHLNRHHTLEAYIRVKKDITKNQSDKDICVLNYEQEELRSIGENIKANIFYFSSQRSLLSGVYLDGEDIIYSGLSHKERVVSVKELNLLGVHNYENVMAGISIGIAMKIPMDCIRKAVLSFQAVEHRIEYVAKKKEVMYYNDSKGTNPDAAIKGIQAMNTKTVLIGGGYDKNSSYEKWIHAFQGKVTFLILIGQTKDSIAKTAKRCGFHNIILADSLEEAVKMSSERAKPGESVLLSPACASWGMFKNYEERGKIFKELVHGLEE